MDETQKIHTQESIIRAISTLVDQRVKAHTTTNSMIGVVVQDPVSFRVDVRINEDVHNCMIAEHLHHWIQKDDVVVVQDLYNDYKKLLITGKTGHTQKKPQLVFGDGRNPDNHISGVDGVFDESGNKITYAIVETEGYGRSSNGVSEIIVSEPSNTWTINHDFRNAYPTVMTLNSENELIKPLSVKYKSDSQIIITFSTNVSGKAVLK